MITEKMHLLIKLLAVILSFMIYGCGKFVEIDQPINQVNTATVYSNDETAISAIRGIYASILSSGGFASGSTLSITLLAGRSADDFNNLNAAPDRKQFSMNNLLPENVFLRARLWQEPYQVIYSTNAMLENLDKSNQISATVKQQLKGEAKFIRAFCHFYLTNLFGDIPIILTTDYRINALAYQCNKAEIYTQIIKDLEDARDYLSDSYPTIERTRPNKWAASALLARAFLYHQDWVNAEKEASEIIAHESKYKILDDLNTVFLKNSSEAILQFVLPTILNVNTYEGRRFILNATPNAILDEVSLSDDLLNAFEPGDMRLSKWVGTYTNSSTSWSYPFKYKIRSGNTPMNEYSMVLRLAEQYLIRAEARIHLEKIDLGIADLNIIRTRSRAMPTPTVPSPLPDLPITMNKMDALLAVEKERRIEMFSEWGHRWFDLKRTNRADAVLKSLKAPNWQATDVLYPIPASEILNAINLKQNLGYQ